MGTVTVAQEVVQRAKHDPSVCGPHGRCSDTKVNDMFFQQQMSSIKFGGWNSLVTKPGYKALCDQMVQGFKQYFRTMGAAPPPINPDEFTVSICLRPLPRRWSCTVALWCHPGTNPCNLSANAIFCRRLGLAFTTAAPSTSHTSTKILAQPQ